MPPALEAQTGKKTPQTLAALSAGGKREGERAEHRRRLRNGPVLENKRAAVPLKRMLFG